MFARQREWDERQARLKPLRPVIKLLREVNRAIRIRTDHAAQKQD